MPQSELAMWAGREKSGSLVGTAADDGWMDGWMEHLTVDTGSVQNILNTAVSTGCRSVTRLQLLFTTTWVGCDCLFDAAYSLNLFVCLVRNCVELFVLFTE